MTTAVHVGNLKQVSINNLPKVSTTNNNHDTNNEHNEEDNNGIK